MRFFSCLLAVFFPLISVAADVEAELHALSVDAGADVEILQGDALGVNWERRMIGEAVMAYRADSARSVEILQMGPVPTRAGHPRFVGPLMGEVSTPALLLYRLRRGEESSDVRSALVEALGSQIQSKPGLGMALIDGEESAEVRQRVVMMIRRASLEVAEPVLQRGFADASPLTQEAAAVTAGNRKDGWRWKSSLLEQLTNDSARVRAASVRSLGWLEQGDAFTRIADLLTDPNAEVRLQSISALHRLDPDRARLHPGLIVLQDDSDPTVASLATRLVNR